MLHREIIAVCSEIHTKHINTAVWAERRIVNVKLAVHIVTTGPDRVKTNICAEIVHWYRDYDCALQYFAASSPKFSFSL